MAPRHNSQIFSQIKKTQKKSGVIKKKKHFKKAQQIAALKKNTCALIGARI